MIWVEQRLWRRTYTIGLAELQAAVLGIGVVLTKDECHKRVIKEIETCTTSMHPSSVFFSSKLQDLTYSPMVKPALV